MKVVVIGGYGVFGSRLARLLVRDGCEIWIAGRSLEKARAEAERIGARPMAVDLRADPEAIFTADPDVVIDAAGPFQSYGDNPYRIARLCIQNGADYLDLSDDAAFTAGIAVLDQSARRTGRRVLSGASSVPCLSSAVVAELARGFDEILLIDTAIVPGNKAPRGASVIASIVGQVGRASPVWRGGMWREVRCWTDRRRYRLAPGLARSGYSIDVPDIRLLPGRFGARSVMFRAGMELGLLNAGLAALGALRQAWTMPVTPSRARLLQGLAALLLPFGTDRGGMEVAVTGLVGGQPRRREWRLIAEAGEGPFVPGVVCRALLRRIGSVPAGARACLAEITLPDIEDAMSDLAVSTTSAETARPTLFQSSLGDRWSLLPPEVRELHGVQDVESFSGFA
jgi:hypothetical protein